MAAIQVSLPNPSPPKIFTALIFVKTSQRTIYYLSITPRIGFCPETKARPECCKRSKGKIHVSTAHEVNLPKLNHGYSNQLT